MQIPKPKIVPADKLIMQDEIYRNTNLNQISNLDYTSDYEMNSFQVLNKGQKVGNLGRHHRNLQSFDFQEKQLRNSPAPEEFRIELSKVDMAEHQSAPEIKRSSNRMFSTMVANFYVKKFVSKFVRRRGDVRAKPYHMSVIHDEGSDLNDIDTIDYRSYSFSVTKLSSLQKLQKQLSKMVKNLEEIQWLNNLFLNVPLIAPESKYKLFWDMLLSAIRIFLLAVVPIEMAFNSKVLFDWLLTPLYISLSLLFLGRQLQYGQQQIDLLLCFNTAYYECGQIVNKRSQIVHNYMHTSFFFDLISVILLFTVANEQVSDGVQFNNSGRKNERHWIYLCLLVIVFQIPNITKVLRKIEESFNFSKQIISLIDLAKLITIVFFFEHLFSCIWYFVGRVQDEQGVKLTWLSKAGIEDSSYSEQYLFAFYYASVTMISVGYGDITPTNNPEMIVAILFMFCSCIQLSYSVSSLFNILTQFNHHKEEVRNKLRSINMYMQKKKISHQLQYKVREYLSYLWQEQSNQEYLQESSIVELLSSKLKDELMIEANSLILKDCQLFEKHFSQNLKKKTLNLIQGLKLFPESTLDSQLKENQLSDSLIFFLESGSIQVQARKRTATLAVLNKGQNFGMEEFVTGNQGQLSYKSVGFTQLLFISRKEFVELLLREFPEDYEEFCMLKDQITLGQSSLNRCYSCNSTSHSIIHCPILHFVPDREFLMKRQAYHNIQPRKHMPTFRSRFTTFNALADQEFLSEVAEAFQFCNEKLADQIAIMGGQGQEEENPESQQPQQQPGSLARMSTSSMRTSVNHQSDRQSFLATIEENDERDQNTPKNNNSNFITLKVPQFQDFPNTSSNSSESSDHPSERLQQQSQNKQSVKRANTFAIDHTSQMGSDSEVKQRAISLKKVAQRRKSQKLNDVKQFMGFKKMKETVFEKMKRVVRKIRTANKFSKKSNKIILRQPMAVQQQQETSGKNLEWKLQQLKTANLHWKESQQLEYLVLQQRAIREEQELKELEWKIDVIREFKIYQPHNNITNSIQLVLHGQQEDRSGLFKLMNYLLYPWEFWNKFKNNVCHPIPQRRKQQQLSSSMRLKLLQGNLERPKEKRKTKAFQQIYNRFSK